MRILLSQFSGLSRGFGFAQFVDIASASAFVVPNYPFVQLPPPASHQAPGYVPPPQTGPPRRVKIDFTPAPVQQNTASRITRAPGSEGTKALFRNDGTRDIGSAPTAVLLLRALDRTTSIDEIAEALKDADNSNGDGAYGLKRIILVCDRASGTGLGFAFVEMMDIEVSLSSRLCGMAVNNHGLQTASTLLGAIMNPKNHPTGFRIASRIVAASFALPYAFQLLPHSAPMEPWCITTSPAIGGVEEGEGWTRYWDEGATVEEKKFEVKPKVKPTKETDVAMAVDAPLTKDDSCKLKSIRPTGERLMQPLISSESR